MLSALDIALHGATAPEYSIKYNFSYSDDLKVVVNHEANRQSLFSPSLPNTSSYFLPLSKRPRNADPAAALYQSTFLIANRKASTIQNKKHKPMPMDAKPSCILVKVPP